MIKIRQCVNKGVKRVLIWQQLHVLKGTWYWLFHQGKVPPNKRQNILNLKILLSINAEFLCKPTTTNTMLEKVTKHNCIKKQKHKQTP